MIHEEQKEYNFKNEEEKLAKIYASFEAELGAEETANLKDFVEDTRLEIKDVYRGICPHKIASTTNPWAGCQNSDVCPSIIKKRRHDEMVALQQKKKKKKKNIMPSINGSIEYCKCNKNPQCLVSLGGIMNEILAMREKSDTFNPEKDPTPKIKDSFIAASELVQAHNTISLSHIRKSISVPKRDIIRHLKHIGFSAPISCALDSIKNYHTSLMFRSKDDPENLELSQPPGMINLGATCYLNSQIQCLAQNITFKEGVLSWSLSTHCKHTSPALPTSSGIGMNAALHNLQLLIARLHHSPKNTVDTTGFTSSLNLLESEMQDPNEFSRLLMDRMMDLCPAMKVNLRKLFEGKLRYETKCEFCDKTRVREEAFMELTLPIPKLKQRKKKENENGNCSSSSSSSCKASPKRTMKGNKKNIFSVKDCVLEYSKVEKLHSENQYECTNCGVKRDAVRTVSFMDLPPVLQIQLGRYEFDIKRNMKKKRMDGARLPLELEIEKKTKTDAFERVSFVLCGVLHHMGSSAHGGHYIAEAMDWTTGVWFEFNDKDVKVLNDGPTGGYCDEKDLAHKTNLSNRNISSSEDAYSMFYVEKQHLARMVENEIQSRIHLPNEGTGSAINRIIRERKAEFKRIEKQQKENEEYLHKMQRRREDIMSKIFSPDTPLHFNPSPNLVWVDGAELRKFLFPPPFQEKIEILDIENNKKSSSLVVNNVDTRKYFCTHKPRGLHPRIARNGKLISVDMYKAYKSLLVGDQKKLEDEGMITCADVWCDECAVSYKEEILSKYKTLLNLLDLFVSLPSSTTKTGKPSEPSTYKSEHNVNDGDYLFVVSTKFISELKRYTIKKVKEIVKDRGIQRDGIDQLSWIELQSADEVLRGGGEPVVDPMVNTRITCVHNNIKSTTSFRSFKLVKKKLWTKLKQLFPLASEHKIKTSITHKDEEFRKAFFASTEFLCLNCFDSERMYQWSQQTLKNSWCHWLARGECNQAKIKCDSDEICKFYFVNGCLLKTWSSALDSCEKKEDGSMVAVNELLNMAKCYLTTEDTDGTNKNKDVVLEQELCCRCKKHNLLLIPPETICFEIFSYMQLENNNTAPMLATSLKNRTERFKKKTYLPVELLSAKEYDCLISSIIGLLQSKFVNNSKRVERMVHHDSMVTISRKMGGGNDVSTIFSPIFCPDCCSGMRFFNMKGFSIDGFQNVESDSMDISSDINPIDVDAIALSNQLKEECGKSIDDDSVEVNVTEATFDLEFPVYFIDDTINICEAAATEARLKASSKRDKVHDMANFLRRSTRKRNARCQKSLKMKMKHSDNLNKLRLLLYAEHNLSPLGQQLIMTVVHSLSTELKNVDLDKENKISKPFTLIELPWEWNHRTMREIIFNERAAEAEEKNCNSTSINNSMIWIYLKYSNEKNTAPNMSKKEKAQHEEALIDSLYWNLSGENHMEKSSNETFKKGAESRRKTELGFLGTFLQSAASANYNKYASSSTLIDMSSDIGEASNEENLKSIENDRKFEATPIAIDTASDNKDIDVIHDKKRKHASIENIKPSKSMCT